MLMTFILGAVPSSLIVPVTEPAVAASTGLPAALAAGALPRVLPLVSASLPQLIIATPEPRRRR